MWPELEKFIKQNEEALRAGRNLPPDKHLGQEERFGQFTCVPVIMTGQRRNFPRVEVESPIASLLQLPRGNIFTIFNEVVEKSSVPNSAELKKLGDYSIMGFLSPEGDFIDPEEAVHLAKPREEPGRAGAGGGAAARPPATTAGGSAELPDTPGTLKNGLWHHIPTGTEFPINDATYHSGAPGGGSVADAPILALGNNLHRVLAVSADTDAWYEDYPPPAAPRNPAMNNAYVRSLRSYLKKMAIQLIERDNWFLLWHGYWYTNSRPLDFERILKNSRYLANPNFINWPDNTTVTEVDANNAASELGRYRWGDLKIAKNTRTINRGGAGPEGARYNAFLRVFEAVGNELKRAFPDIFARRPVAATEDTELTGDLLQALVEGRLDESLTYNQMLTATANYWQTRLKTVRNVHTQPPGLVMLKDGTVDLSFNFVSRPSTEGRPHMGYVKFIPEKGQPRLIDKLKDFLGRIGQQVKKFIGKKVPPQALKGSDLRKMLCEVSCDCKDFKYRMSYANVKAGVTTQAGRTDNGAAPVRTNPARRPGFCKHILATLRYLTDDAEIQISKELSREQQEALKKDRTQFYQEAQVAYEEMKAPAAKGAEEIEPEEEEPPSPEFAKLPAPPKPELAVPPPLPVAAPTPPTPNYPSQQ